MKRIIIICEGPTEQAFIKTNMFATFIQKGIHLQTPVIKASKGGIVKWSQLKEQIEIHLKSDTDAIVTTFIDYYGLYSKYEFPGWNDAHTIQDINDRLDSLENYMLKNIDKKLQNRFLPYLQLHEFEGLLFNELSVFIEQIPNKDILKMEELKKIFVDFPNPEMINNSKETSPSHRLKRIINGYNKIVYGDILSEAIGLERIRNKSPRFNNWLKKMETF